MNGRNWSWKGRLLLLYQSGVVVRRIRVCSHYTKRPWALTPCIIKLSRTAAGVAVLTYSYSCWLSRAYTSIRQMSFLIFQFLLPTYLAHDVQGVQIKGLLRINSPEGRIHTYIRGGAAICPTQRLQKFRYLKAPKIPISQGSKKLRHCFWLGS